MYHIAPNAQKVHLLSLYLKNCDKFLTFYLAYFVTKHQSPKYKLIIKLVIGYLILNHH